MGSKIGARGPAETPRGPSAGSDCNSAGSDCKLIARQWLSAPVITACTWLGVRLPAHDVEQLAVQADGTAVPPSSWPRAAPSHQSCLHAPPDTFSHIIVPSSAVSGLPYRVLSSPPSRPAGRDRGKLGLQFRSAPAGAGLQVNHKKPCPRRWSLAIGMH